jgi:hypothetical protein
MAVRIPQNQTASKTTASKKAAHQVNETTGVNYHFITRPLTYLLDVNELIALPWLGLANACTSQTRARLV